MSVRMEWRCVRSRETHVHYICAVPLLKLLRVVAIHFIDWEKAELDELGREVVLTTERSRVSWTNWASMMSAFGSVKSHRACWSTNLRAWSYVNVSHPGSQVIMRNGHCHCHIHSLQCNFHIKSHSRHSHRGKQKYNKNSIIHNEHIDHQDHINNI